MNITMTGPNFRTNYLIVVEIYYMDKSTEPPTVATMETHGFFLLMLMSEDIWSSVLSELAELW